MVVRIRLVVLEDAEDIAYVGCPIMKKHDLKGGYFCINGIGK